VTGGTFNTMSMDTDAGLLLWGDVLTVSGFRLDKYLVTVGRFRQFVAAWNKGAGYLPSAGAGKHSYLNGGLGLINNCPAGGYESGWKTAWSAAVTPTNAVLRSSGGTWTSTPGTQENLPINGVNWYEAYAFCIWDGGFLPSDGEWSYATLGGSQQRQYPWGSTPPGPTDQYAIYECAYPDAGGNCAVTTVAPVGTAWRGAGRWGQVDLLGQTYEWEIDWNDNPGGACTDCACLTGGGSRIMDGCSLTAPAEVLGALPRTEADVPLSRAIYEGFRCARSP
jgi:formylglycine-generating enzyme required for sulfatase activity